MVTKPPVFWVVDISSGKYDKQPLPDEIGSERLGMVIREAAESGHVPDDLSDPKQDKTQPSLEFPTSRDVDGDFRKYMDWYQLFRD